MTKCYCATAAGRCFDGIQGGVRHLYKGDKQQCRNGHKWTMDTNKVDTIQSCEKHLICPNPYLNDCVAPYCLNTSKSTANPQ